MTGIELETCKRPHQSFAIVVGTMTNHGHAMKMFFSHNYIYSNNYKLRILGKVAEETYKNDLNKFI